MAKAMARAPQVDVRKGRTTLALLGLAGTAWLLQAVAFVLASPRGSPQVLTARGAAEESSDVVGVLPTRMKDLRVGQELQGIITTVRERIALVDVGVEKVGLLPSSKLQDGRPPDSMLDKLKEGDSITVFVAEVENPDDPRNGKLVLSGHKNKILNPFQFGDRAAPEDLKEVVAAQKDLEDLVYYKAVVTAVKDGMGVIVAFRVPEAPGITSGLVYRTEVEGAPKVMDHIKVRILDVDGNRVKLSMRDEAPLTGAAAKFGDFRELVNKTCPGKVTGLVDFGAWVEVTSEKGTTRGALLPASEIEDCYVEDPAEFLEVGQELKVKILEITEKGIRVSKKQAVEAED